jgi:hypothetical protein
MPLPRATIHAVALSAILYTGATTSILAGASSTIERSAHVATEIIEPPLSRWQARADEDSILVVGHRPAQAKSNQVQAQPSSEQFRRAPALMCGIDNVLRTDLNVTMECTADVNRPLAQSCTVEERAVDPLFRRQQEATAPGGWGPWEMVDDGCLTIADINLAIAEEFRRLPLTPSTLSIQPPSGWTLVNAETIAYADGTTQTLATAVLGLNATIRATPKTFTWTFGDGSASVTTTHAGAPWPDHTISHRYSAEGTHSIGLTTAWGGLYQLEGSSEWIPIDGVATTTSTSPPLTVYEARSRLVSGPSS